MHQLLLVVCWERDIMLTIMQENLLSFYENLIHAANVFIFPLVISMHANLLAALKFRFFLSVFKKNYS